MRRHIKTDHPASAFISQQKLTGIFPMENIYRDLFGTLLPPLTPLLLLHFWKFPLLFLPSSLPEYRFKLPIEDGGGSGERWRSAASPSYLGIGIKRLVYCCEIRNQKWRRDKEMDKSDSLRPVHEFRNEIRMEEFSCVYVTRFKVTQWFADRGW